MSLDAQRFVELMKQAAKMVADESAPFSFCIGKVLTPATDGTKVDGLRVQVGQKLTLSDKQLILTNAVRDYYVKLTTVGEELNQPDGKEHVTEKRERLSTAGPSGTAGLPGDDNAYESHDHDYKGDKWWKVNLKLQTGERVLLLRIDGGQKYIVLDRVHAPNNKGLIQ